ncbi:MAG: ABC transporter permease [Gemmatimonadetes bacterium]|nr:ABC transporter permease [Gemmatimonadota bacterium]
MDQRDAALGDAEEEFRQVQGREGRAAARRWYRRQVLRSVIPCVAHRLRTGAALWGQSEREGERMRAWGQDIQLALRSLRRRPGFAVTVLVTLALGVGVTTALFGVFRAVFLEPLPLPDSDELVVVMEQAGFGCCGPASGPDYLDWVQRNRTFESLAALNPGPFTLTGQSEPERVYGTYATASAFDVVGVAPAMGRPLLPEDQTAGGVVVLSHTLWRDAFGGQPDVLGRTLELDGRPHEIVGVMPEGFDIPSPWSQLGQLRVYVPFLNERLEGDRGSHGFPVVGRLAEGVSKETAQADMDRVMRELAVEYPQTNADRSTKIFTVHEYLYGAVGTQLGMILGAAAVVLLIACGNVAGLLLARAAGREGELAVRSALGATRRAVVRLLFSEALVLAVSGGVLGLLFSLLALDAFKALLPPTIPRVDAIAIDGWALGFALGVSALTALVFGMLPALLASRTDLAGVVKEGGYATLAPRKERMRNAFIVGQLALGLVLANGAALLVQSYAALRTQDFGFQTEGVITMAVSPAGPRYEEGATRAAFLDRVREQVAGIPGVVSVGTTTRLPLFGGSNGNVWVEGTPPRQNDGEGPLVEVAGVTGDYFAAMDIPLLAGRVLQHQDSAESAIGVVINQRFADVAWPGEDALGKRFSFSDDPPQWLSVVGVVGDVKQWGPEQPPQAQLYAPYVHGWSSSAYLTVRTAGDPAPLVAQVRQAILAVDPSVPPSDVRMMGERVDRTFAQRRFYTTLVGLFAVAALFLAAAGVYGTISYFVARRTRELGIRMALGAGRTGIVGLVVRRGVRLAAVGVALGLLGVWASTRVLEGLVYEIRTLDPLTLIAGGLVLALVAVSASAIPAARAVRVPPTEALRSE